MDRTLLNLLLTVLLVTFASQAHSQQSDTIKRPQAALQESLDELNHANDSLQRIYEHFLQEYAKDPEFTKWLTTSQKVWLELRDANMHMRFPHKDDEDANLWYGSVFPSCYNLILTNLTNSRITFLNQWVEGVREGDVCSGSIKFK